MASTPSSCGDVDDLVERFEALLGDGRVDADAERRALLLRRGLQAAQAGGGALERAFHAARLVVQLARAVDRDADVLEESLLREGRAGRRLARR